MVESRPVLLVLTSTYPRWKGDPEPGFVHELAKRLTDRFRVVVLGPHAPGASTMEILDDVEVHRYRYAPSRLETLVNDGGIVANLRLHRWKMLLVPGFVLAQAWGAWRLCRRLGVDVIHAHWLLPQGLIAAMLQGLPGRRAPFVVTSHGADLYALKGRVLDAMKRFVAGRAAAVTVVSNSMRDELSRIGADPAKVEVLSMGVDLDERFKPQGVPRDQDELLFVGRLVEKKGVHVLIDAMAEILRVRPSTRLTIAGFGPEEARLKNRAKSLGVEGAIRFLGPIPQPELPALYSRAALFVAPFIEASDGDREGLGLVTIEAIACGCPVVVGDLPAIRDVLDQAGEEWMRVRPGDANALAQAVLSSLASPVQRAEMAQLIRARLKKRFNWHEVARTYALVLLRAQGSQ